MFQFEQLAADRNSHARSGRIHTVHGHFETPAFMPVGTRAAIKGLTPEQLRATGTSIILANTYHLWQRPGADVVAEAGGLHAFMNWPGPILTDSGGYQVFSLADLAKIQDDGVIFKSHIDGAQLVLDPETAIEVQSKLGSDIAMVLDQCTRYPCSYDEARVAVTRTLRWARACKSSHQRSDQALFGIVQGGVFAELRKRCADELIEVGFDGYALGGLSVGEPFELLVEMLAEVPQTLPEMAPRYLMGVGLPRDILAAVRQGVDMFDCVLPTRNGRNAYAFTPNGPLRLRNEQHKRSSEPIDPGCDCYCCTHFSRSYIRHLFNVEEMLGPVLTSVHNIRFYQRFMARLRELIRLNDLEHICVEFPIARA